MDRVLSSSARILLSWSILAMILSISLETLAGGWRGGGGPEPEEEPPLLETATGEAVMPPRSPTPPPMPPVPPSAAKHTLSVTDVTGTHRGGNVADHSRCKYWGSRGREGREGRVGGWGGRGWWYPRYRVMAEIERVWRETNKQNKQTNKCCKLKQWRCYTRLD